MIPDVITNDKIRFIGFPPDNNKILGPSAWIYHAPGKHKKLLSKRKLLKDKYSGLSF